MKREDIFEDISGEIDDILEKGSDTDEVLSEVARILKERVPHYDWVGFYIADPEGKEELHLGPFAGEPTEHERIPFGKGICGRAASELDTIVIQDVSEQDNYLSCSPFVRSEVVVPIISGGEFVAELDIDSHDLGPFSDLDRSFLEDICSRLSSLF